jgi:hypothetical protein
MKNRVELRNYIRYQLAQLSARNGEHEFESLCFELARLRQVSNLQPATGPVKAGGDQGRDFESYQTYLAGTAIARSTFATMASSDLVVGACTLNKQTSTKIRSDLKILFGSDQPPDRILYFCEPDLPVSKRHELQRECQTLYRANLDVFDGQAIADQLSDPDTFWIAEQYLAVPAESYPKEEIDQAYQERRVRWLKEATQPENYADFLDVKMGLRRATHDDGAKPDLLQWLARMREFDDQDFGSRLRQKARYEIAVAELRGRGNLDPALPLVRAFFDDLGATSERPSDLLDAAVLGTYCWGAFNNRQTRLSVDTIGRYLDKVAGFIASSLAETTRRGDRCTLLEGRAMLAAVPKPGHDREAVPRQMLEAWHNVVKEAEQIPFFPIDHLADLVEMFAPLMAHDETFRALRDDIDRLWEKRAGGHEVAERSRRRALGHLKSGNRLAAIDELQRAKVGWFTGDEMPNSVWTMLLLSECYSHLGFHIASRYYAAGATYIALHSDDDNVRHLLSEAGFALAQTFYSAGECTTFLLSLKQIIGMHLAVAQDPTNLRRHPEYGRALAHAAIFKAITGRLATHLNDTIDAALAAWPLDKEQVDRLMAMEAAPPSPWSTMNVSNLEDAIERDLGRSPFSDIGGTHEVSWSALGIRWTVQYSSEQPTRLAALELVATLQIAQVELADAELLIIPSDALIMVGIGHVERPEINQLPNNEQFVWKVMLPLEQPEDMDAGFAENVAVAVTVIGQLTALDRHVFMAAIERSFARGLPHRVVSVRPARELMEFALAQANGVENLNRLKPVKLSRPIRIDEPPELAWRSTAGPGYSREKANQFLANRYDRSSKAIRLTLPRLLADGRIHALLLNLRACGFLDWQILAILANIVAQYQVEVRVGKPLSRGMERLVRDRLFRTESGDDPQFDLNLIDEGRLALQASALLAATFLTWGLVSHGQTPNLVGMKRLLDARYGHSTDDIPHAELFPPPG